MTKFYKFRQNNSGGRFHFDAERGISVEVWVEAPDEATAVVRAEKIGLYFNGCDDGRDCSCCGDRWYTPYDSEDTAPTVVEGWSPWAEGRGCAEGYVHFADGRVEPLPFKTSRH